MGCTGPYDNIHPTKVQYSKDSPNPSSKAKLTTGHSAFRPEPVEGRGSPPAKIRNGGGAARMTISSFSLAAFNPKFAKRIPKEYKIMRKISILEKSRAPSRIAFCEGLGLGYSGSHHVVVEHVRLDSRLIAHESKSDLGVEAQSHLLGQLSDQFDLLAPVHLEDPVLFTSTVRTVAEPDRAKEIPPRFSFDEAEQALPRLRLGGVLTQDAEFTGLNQRAGHAGAVSDVEPLREKKPPDFDREGLLIVNEFDFVAHCLPLSRYCLTASSHHDLISCHLTILCLCCQEQQKIRNIAVFRFLAPRIKKFSSPKIKICRTYAL